MLGEILLIVLSFVLVITGGIGVILPFLPGVPFAWLGMLIFAYATQFSVITWKIVLIFFGLTLFTIVLDIVAPFVGAKKFKASRYGIIGSLLGFLIGMFIFGPIGIIIGTFSGALIGEMVWGKQEQEALKSAAGTMIGFLAGGVIKLVIIVIIFGFMLFSLFL